VVVAKRLRHLVRDEDSIARLGGDEFAVILQGSDAEGAGTIRGRIEATLSATASVGDLLLPLRASCGLAVLEPGERADQLMARADRAMYERKGARR
jgi:diguanylate cyclase (GGDEF)-like protein